MALEDRGREAVTALEDINHVGGYPGSLAAPALAGADRPSLADDALGFQLFLQQTHRAERDIAAEDVPNCIGLAGDDDELAVCSTVPAAIERPRPLVGPCFR
jgi:hypothetical protein